MRHLLRPANEEEIMEERTDYNLTPVEYDFPEEYAVYFSDGDRVDIRIIMRYNRTRELRAELNETTDHRLLLDPRTQEEFSAEDLALITEQRPTLFQEPQIAHHQIEYFRNTGLEIISSRSIAAHPPFRNSILQRMATNSPIPGIDEISLEQTDFYVDTTNALPISTNAPDISQWFMDNLNNISVVETALNLAILSVPLAIGGRRGVGVGLALTALACTTQKSHFGDRLLIGEIPELFRNAGNQLIARLQQRWYSLNAAAETTAADSIVVPMEAQEEVVEVVSERSRRKYGCCRSFFARFFQPTPVESDLPELSDVNTSTQILNNDNNNSNVNTEESVRRRTPGFRRDMDNVD